MKRWLDSLHRLRKGNPFLLHGSNQGLSHTRRQLQYLFHCFRLNQKTGQNRAGGKIATFFERVDFKWQNIFCHRVK